MTDIIATQSPSYLCDFYLDSRQRSNGTINQCSFNLAIPIQKCLSVTLKSFQSYNSIYTVNLTNNTLVISGVGIVSITPGFYDTTSLPTTLQTALNALGSGTWTVTYSVILGLITITVNTSKTINWSSSTIGSMLGFPPSLGSVTGTTFISTNLVNLNPQNYILIRSLNLVENFNSGNVTGPQNILEKIPINVPTGSLINFNCYNTELCYVEFSSPRTIPMIDIALTDINGNILSILTDWSCVLQFEIEED